LERSGGAREIMCMTQMEVSVALNVGVP